jgi:hypothetical protein
LVNLHALLNGLNKICRSRLGSTVNAPRFSWASLREFACARLHLVEQPHVLNGDHRLMGEGGKQLDLLVDEGL